MSIYYTDDWDLGSVFDAAGNVVQLNLLVGETGYGIEPINQEHTTGDYQSGERNSMMLESPDFEGESQIESWKAARTPLRMVAIGKGRFSRSMIWTVFTAAKQLLPMTKVKRNEGDNSLKITLEKDDASPKQRKNLIYGEAGTSLVLPIAGIDLTLAATKASAFDLTLEAFDYGTDGTDGSSLGSATDSFNNERGSVTLTLPANTWRIDWTLNGATQASLRADGLEDYVAG